MKTLGIIFGMVLAGSILAAPLAAGDTAASNDKAGASDERREQRREARRERREAISKGVAEIRGADQGPKKSEAQQKSKDKKSHEKGPKGKNDKTRKTVSAKGEILRMKKVDLRNQDKQHVVVLVKTSPTRHGVVDLGPPKGLKELKLKQGDTISVKGKPARVGKRGVLMASHVEVQGREGQAGKKVRIRRSDQPRKAAGKAVRRSDGQQPAKAATPRKETFRGKVEGTKKVRVKKLKQDHVLALIRTADGKTRIVDFGPVEDLRGVRLTRGDTVVASGDVIVVGSREVLMAHTRKTRMKGNDGPTGDTEQQSQAECERKRQKR